MFWGTRYEEPAFFTILGPEGVGKTTLCNNLIRIFRNYPIAFRQFHHTSEWKGGNPDDAAMTASAKIQVETFGDTHHEEARQGSSSGIRSAVRHAMPSWLYRNISAFRAELIYMRRVVTYLMNCHFRGELVIADRYCYDRLVRWRNLKKPPGQRIGAYLVSRLMRRPFHAFVLRDTPERIAARKQAMPEWEIAKHQEMLVAVCRRFGVPFEEIWVSDLDADAVAQLVARQILESTGNTVFDLIDRHLAEASQR
jgi:thymidylate kinase